MGLKPGGSGGLPLRTWVVFLGLLHSSFLASCVDPNSLEEQALRDFKAENAATSTALQSWLDGNNHCTNWKGVECWSTGFVRWLRLPGASLSGNMSRALGRLAYLSRLTLSENSLTGEIPDDFAVMVHLKKLALDGNQLNGHLPDWLGTLVLLDELNLGNNAFEGPIPQGLFSNFRQVVTLDFGGNKLSGSIPGDLADIPTLQFLSLRSNNFSGPIPSSLANAGALVTADLSKNSLQGTLPATWNTPNLTSLDLSGNSLQGEIPAALFNLTSLKDLKLGNNNFTGSVPQDIACQFGNLAFQGNPLLIVETCPYQGSPGPQPPFDGIPLGSEMPPPSGFYEHKKSKGFSNLTIVALTAGDVALLLMSAVGFTLFWLWWKKRKASEKYGGGKGGWSKEDKSTSTTLRSVDGKELRQEPDPNRPTFIAAASLRPALKCVVEVMPDPEEYSDEVMIEELGAEKSETSDSCEDFGTDLKILDRTLVLKIEELLKANAMVLGTGTFGGVYMAVMEDKRMLAIKRLEEHGLKNEHVFGDKIRRLAKVTHPNLLNIRAYCWSPNEKLLICDFMSNGSLYSLMHGDLEQRHENLSWAARHNIALEAARGLAHLHDINMVHGNFKATNVLLDDRFEVRVADFGLETLLETPSTHITAEGYLAPELMASSRNKSQKGDVYSFGVLLLELLTGLEPKGKSDKDLATWVLEMVSENKTVEVFDPSLVSMHVLPAQDVLELLELALACIADEPGRRPTMTTVLRTLETIIPSGGFLPGAPAVLSQHMGEDFSSVEHGYPDYAAELSMHSSGYQSSERPRASTHIYSPDRESPDSSYGSARRYSSASVSSISPLKVGFSSSSGRNPYD